MAENRRKERQLARQQERQQANKEYRSVEEQRRRAIRVFCMYDMAKPLEPNKELDTNITRHFDILERYNIDGFAINYDDSVLVDPFFDKPTNRKLFFIVKDEDILPLMKYFKHEHYLKIDNKPVLFRLNVTHEMDTLNNLCIEHGFSGICLQTANKRIQTLRFDQDENVQEKIEHAVAHYMNTPSTSAYDNILLIDSWNYIAPSEQKGYFLLESIQKSLKLHTRHRVLKYIHKYDFTRTIVKPTYGIDRQFYSSTPSILLHTTNPVRYIVNIRWVDYTYTKEGFLQHLHGHRQSLNSRFMVDEHFQKLNDEVFLEERFSEPTSHHGLEDIRMFSFADRIYYSASIINGPHNIVTMACGDYTVDDAQYGLDVHNIFPIFHDTPKFEKNWAYFDYNGKLSMVYNWHPLQLGTVDFCKQTFQITEVKPNIPEWFKDARGSTPGYTYNDEIWFILHKAQYTHKSKITTLRTYQHFFAVFDRSMNVLRYSELFKFEDSLVEFCVGLIIEPTRTIVSYSSMDKSAKIGVLDNTYIKDSIWWYVV